MSRTRLLVAALGALVVAAPFVVSVDAPTSSARAHSFLQLDSLREPGPGDGLSPADIASAYGLSGGVGGTVAIATAFSDPRLEADLGVYRSTFGLPPCTRANGCLRIVGESGTASLPAADVGWGQETSLDVAAVSAACPGCRILVVEADSDDLGDLGEAVNTAVRLGADAVSASWGNTEWSSWSRTAAAYFTHAGVPIVAATGDSGHEAATFPAAFPNVIAVGGTTLTGTSTSSGTAGALQTFAVHDGTVTASRTSAAVTADTRAVAKAKARFATAKRHTVALKKRAHVARVQLKRARTAYAKAVGRHRVRTADRAVVRARTAQSAAAAAVKRAQAVLLKDRAAEAGATAAAARAAQTTRTGWIETAWSGAGSGCSAFVPKPGWQPGTTCGRRGIADVAAVADPASGIATYDSYGTSADETGWLVAGGTSLAAPLIAAMMVRSGHASRYSSAEALYADPAAFWDVTAGSNGSCRGALCTAGPGYDGPTGLGTPRSLASF